jgi:hypothetical protein
MNVQQRHGDKAHCVTPRGRMPANSFVILDVLLGLDLAFWDTAWIGFGLCLRRY